MKDLNKKKEKDKKFHNYIALILIFVFCIIIVLYISELYKVRKQEELQIPIIKDSLNEIYSDDLEHYILDNPTTVLYICKADDNNCRSFERDFKKLLKKNNYDNLILYLNVTDIDYNKFKNDFNNRYKYKTELANYPAFVIFEDGEISSILQGKNNKPLTIKKVKQYLELNEIGE